MYQRTAPIVLCALLASSAAFAAEPSDTSAASSPLVISKATLALAGANMAVSQDTSAPHPVAMEYSDGYMLRRKIHKVASIATLPLFVSDLAVGQSLYDGTSRSDSKRNAHAVLGSSIGVLFGVNTVTGVWNMWEARHDANGRTRRLAHGLLMLGADAGFMATSMTAPESEHGGPEGGDRSLHRSLAITSMGAATASYLLMLFGGK